LKNIDGVQRVETFAKSHTKIYNLLLILKQISKMFMGIIAVISFLLILKQIQVWHLEHRERMYIMELFGAPLWMRSGILIKLSIIDTVIGVLALYGVYYYLLSSDILQNLIGNLKIRIELSKIIQDCLLLGSFGLLITLFSVIYVSTRHIKE